MRGRGLKQKVGLVWLKMTIVAPHAGAWIETYKGKEDHNGPSVAPHAGAWIETSLCSSRNLYQIVAPHAGAWIETI